MSSSTSYSSFPPIEEEEATTSATNDSSIPTSISTSSSQQPKSNPKTPLALPPTTSTSTQSTNDTAPTTQLNISTGSTSVKLDHLGPMVVNVDGTLSRIANWEGMTVGERESTVRVVGRRNRERLRVLREREGEIKEGRIEEKGRK